MPEKLDRCVKKVTKQRSEVKLVKVNTDVQVGDVYVPGKGIFRFAGA